MVRRRHENKPPALLLLPLLLLIHRPCGGADRASETCAADVAGAAADEGPCTIERVRMEDLDGGRFEAHYKERRPLVVITGLEYNARLRMALDREALLAEYGDMVVSLGTAESYTGKSTVHVPFRRYIEEMITAPQTLHSLGNETYYLFGSSSGERFPELLADYRLPPYEAAVHEGQYSTLSFGLAGQGSGVPFHGHGPGWSEVLHGRKRWFLYPRDESRKASQIVPFDPDESQLQWLRYVYPTLPAEKMPVECTIHPGEMLYFPTWWLHAVLNLDNYTTFVSTFQ